MIYLRLFLYLKKNLILNSPTTGSQENEEENGESFNLNFYDSGEEQSHEDIRLKRKNGSVFKEDEHRNIIDLLVRMVLSEKKQAKKISNRNWIMRDGR